MKHTLRGIFSSACIAGTLVFASAFAVQAQDVEKHDYEHSEEAQMFIHGQPEMPSDIWMQAAGGRMYDNWWDALDREAPVELGTHPSYPADGKASGVGTWRCKECHGWDYRGKDGVYRKGSHFTGIVGIRGAVGMPEAQIAALMRSPSHGYTEEMITDEEMRRLTAFVSRGQVDMSTIVDGETRAIIGGDLEHGRSIFQTVCAACHGFDGRRLNWGSMEEPAFVGTEAADVPDEVLNKILNAHPGVDMINLRAFPLHNSVDVLRYASTLPTSY